MEDIDGLYTALTKMRRKTTKEAPLEERRAYLAKLRRDTASGNARRRSGGLLSRPLL